MITDPPPILVPRPETGESSPVDLAAVGLRNFRDVGGLPAGDGRRVRRGLLFRSTDLSGIDGRTRNALVELGIRTVFDLRTAAERELWPEAERLPDGVGYVVADVLGDSPEGTPAQFMALLDDPPRMRELLTRSGGERLFLRRYREFVSLASARRSFHLILSDLAAPGRLPAIVHCTTGKDRTGWLVAVLQLSLGVAAPDVLDDYLASNREMGALQRELAARFGEAGAETSLVAPLMEVRTAYLEAALDEARRGYGSFDGYLDVGLAVGRATRRRLAEVFVEAG